jgi:hypothetical protein
MIGVLIDVFTVFDVFNVSTGGQVLDGVVGGVGTTGVLLLDKFTFGEQSLNSLSSITITILPNKSYSDVVLVTLPEYKGDKFATIA